MSLENDLQKIGLDNKEARIYLAALELGPATIQNIADKSSIKRTTVYQILDKLKEQGLVSETTDKKRKLIVAADPVNLKRNIKTKEQLLNNILPNLQALSNLNPIKPKITFYKGIEGYREIYLDTLKAKTKTALWISPFEIQQETIGEEFLNDYIDKRVKNKIWIKLIQKISADTPARFFDPRLHEKQFKQVRFLTEATSVPNVIVVYDNKVAIMSTKKEGFGFVVESKDYAESMKIFHKLLWETSRTYGDFIEK